jgi:hypothetical protein
MLIALLATFAFAAVWLVALRPGPEAGEPAPNVATAPGTGGLGRSVDKATGAVQNGPGVTAAGAPSTTQPPAAPATKPAKPAKAAAARDRSHVVLRDLARGRVVAMLFWDGRSSDDRAVRAAMREVDRRGGRVAVHVARITQVGAYPSVTRGVQISSSPTVLVIDRARRGSTLTGLTDAREIDQRVGDALASGRR